MTRLSDAKAYAKSDVKTILEKVKEVVDLEVERTTIFNAEIESSIPRFQASELVLGRVVGRGGFCVVRELNQIRLLSAADASSSDPKARSSRPRDNSRTRSFMRGNNNGSTISESTDKNLEMCSREHLARRVYSKKGGKYVVKQIEPSLLDSNKVDVLKGTIDLALETKYLASLQHTHIVSIKGICRTSPYDEIGYFVVLDQMPEILSKRLTAWMHSFRATRGITGFMTGGRKRATGLLTERLLVAYDVAEAMDYLHSKRIIYRDLKPDNIGFDNEGVLKIFDFGLAKELSEDHLTENGLYHMTGCTGALRYMAPEVGLNQPYNLKADVYSWSMLLWYIMALEPPMGLYTPKMFVERVFKKGYRPATYEKWPTGISSLLKQSWHEEIESRPDFKEIKTRLKGEIRKIDPHIATIMVDSTNDVHTAETVEVDS